MKRIITFVCGCILTGCATVGPVQKASVDIGVSPSDLAFRGVVYGAVADQTIVVTNGRDATLNYTLSSDTFWLSVPNASGSLSAASSRPHTVRVRILGLSPRIYHGRLTIADPSATNSPVIAWVILTVLSSAPPSMVIAWGGNRDGQTNVPADLGDAVAIDGGRSRHCLALKSDGTVVAWGDGTYGMKNVPADLTNAVAIAEGFLHSMALRSDGAVVAWGQNDFGQANVPVGLTNAVAIAGGYFHSLALKSDGTVVAWGWNLYGQLKVPTGLSNVVAIAGGGDFSLALKSDGTVAAWGWNNRSQTNVPAGLSNVVAIAAGVYHALALRSDGTVVAWGYNDSGQTNVPAGLTNAVALDGGVCHSMALVAGRRALLESSSETTTSGAFFTAQSDVQDGVVSP